MLVGKVRKPVICLLPGLYGLATPAAVPKLVTRPEGKPVILPRGPLYTAVAFALLLAVFGASPLLIMDFHKLLLSPDELGATEFAFAILAIAVFPS